jgi:uncharacterized heparinase superfamily protein
MTEALVSKSDAKTPKDAKGTAKANAKAKSRAAELVEGASVDEKREESAIPLAEGGEEPITTVSEDGAVPLPSSRALTLSDFVPPSAGPGERLIRMAYRIGIPGSTLVSPFRKPLRPRLTATVESPLQGDRAAGMALRAGHFLIHGTKTPIAEMDMKSKSRLAPSFERAVHGFDWLRDLAAAGTREQCASTAERISASWLKANAKPNKGAAWKVELAGHRLLACLVHAPLILSSDDKASRNEMLEAMEGCARWLDRHVTRETDRLGAISGWTAITAAGLLMPEGKPRRLFGEAGLLKALGDLVAEDGGVLSRSPAAQMDAIALLVDLRSCYEAADEEMPESLTIMLGLLVPPLLALRHGDGGLGSWHGAGAIDADRVAALIDASGIRTRPLKDIREWGFQRMTGGKVTVQFDAAPPPRARFSRWGCASTLAFEMSEGSHRLIVNCGGAMTAGGLVPMRIEQGLRASAAHSALILDNVNSTAVLIKGKLGKGVEKVEVDSRTLMQKGGEATRVEASHDGYVARFGLLHRRILMLRGDGSELRGEDFLISEAKRAKRGKIGFAIRFHLGREVEAQISEDRRGASLVLPNGNLWQFRMAGGESDVSVSLEESIWVDGAGKPYPIEQLVIQGMTSRGGEQFSWLLKKMG